MIRLLEVAAASVPTPPAGKVWLFLDLSTGIPSFKDEAGVVTPITTGDAELAAIAALVSAANKIIRFTGSGTADLLDFDIDGTLAANSDTRIASQKAIRTYVAAQIAALIASAPGALDTLDELAAALGDDANFASTVTTALAGKLAIANNLSDLASPGTARTNLNIDYYTLPFMIGDGINVITTGIKGPIPIDIPGDIVEVTLLADQAGSIVVDLWKRAYGSYPPTVAQTITAAAKPTLSAANKSTDNTLTGWTVGLAARDVLFVNVDSAATCTWVMLWIKVRRT